jgi:hypothetical protein
MARYRALILVVVQIGQCTILVTSPATDIHPATIHGQKDINFYIWYCNDFTSDQALC